MTSMTSCDTKMISAYLGGQGFFKRTSSPRRDGLYYTLCSMYVVGLNQQV